MRTGFTALFLLLGIAQTHASLLYHNGSIVGDRADALTDGQSVSDSFDIYDASVLSNISIGAWVAAGDLPEFITWSIGSTPFSTDFSGVSALSNTFVDSVLVGNPAASFDLYESTFDLNVLLQGGTYWLTLKSGTTQQNGELAWDFGNGFSQSQRFNQGTVTRLESSHSFQVYGELAGNVVVTPEPASISLAAFSALAMLIGARRRQPVARCS